MSGLVDLMLVGVVIVASAIYAGLALGPRSWRRRLDRWRGRATAGAACGGCDSCDSTGGPTAAGPSEARIPLAAIRRRRE